MLLGVLTSQTQRGTICKVLDGMRASSLARSSKKKTKKKTKNEGGAGANDDTGLGWLAASNDEILDLFERQLRICMMHGHVDGQDAYASGGAEKCAFTTIIDLAHPHPEDPLQDGSTLVAGLQKEGSAASQGPIRSGFELMRAWPLHLPPARQLRQATPGRQPGSNAPGGSRSDASSSTTPMRPSPRSRAPLSRRSRSCARLRVARSIARCLGGGWRAHGTPSTQSGRVGRIPMPMTRRWATPTTRWTRRRDAGRTRDRRRDARAPTARAIIARLGNGRTLQDVWDNLTRSLPNCYRTNQGSYFTWEEVTRTRVSLGIGLQKIFN